MGDADRRAPCEPGDPGHPRPNGRGGGVSRLRAAQVDQPGDHQTSHDGSAGERDPGGDAGDLTDRRPGKAGQQQAPQRLATNVRIRHETGLGPRDPDRRAALPRAEKTVKNYVSNILMKLGMHHRTEAAVYATRLADRRRRESG